MTLTAIALAALLGQADAVAATPAVEAPPMSDADKALAAARTAAEAAERASKAVERLANELAGPPMAAPGAPSATGWVGSIGLGLSWITGNTSQLTATGNVGLDKKWTDWALGIRLNGAYGLANPTAFLGGEPAVTARRAGGTIRGDRSFGSGFAAIFLLAGAEFDHIKNVEFRGIGEAGAALTFFNKKQDDYEKLFLRLDLAMRAGGETRFEYFGMNRNRPVNPYSIVILAPRIAATFRYGFNKFVRFSNELEVIPFLLGEFRMLLNNNMKLNARLTENLSIAIAWLLNVDTLPPGTSNGPAGPAPGTMGTRLPIDSALTVGFDATF
jgi:hypothetical protein